MSWRSDLINGMTHREALTLLAMIAGGQPEAFDWALSGLGGTFAERFAQAREGAGEMPRATLYLCCEHCEHDDAGIPPDEHPEPCVHGCNDDNTVNGDGR